MIVIFFTIYDMLIWLYRVFVRRERYLTERLKVMNRELACKWPYKSLCLDHMNVEENEHLMKGKKFVLEIKRNFTHIIDGEKQGKLVLMLNFLCFLFKSEKNYVL